MSATICEVGDCSLTAEDLELIRTPCSWLNDNLITFYLEWARLHQANDSVVVLHPTACFMFRLLPVEDVLVGDGNPFVRAREDSQVKLIIAPINNATDTECAGAGSHWSLLVVDKSRRVAVHYDSFSGTNQTIARETKLCFERLVGHKLAFEESANCEQQGNGYDCGVFALLNFREIYFSNQLPVRTAPEFRQELLHLILEACHSNNKG